MTRKTMGTRIGTLVFACASVATGCSGSESSSAGVAQWGLEEDLRIGSTSDPGQSLTTVGSLAVDDDGMVYVAQPDQGHIRVYDEQGRGVRAIGSPGPQPGQFQRLYTVGLLGDSVYAIDLGLRRITYFSKQGELLGFEQVSPPPIQPPFLPSMPFVLFPDGSRAIGTAFPPTLTADQLRRVPQLRMRAGSEALDTVAWIGYEHTARRALWQERPLPVGSPLSDDPFAVFDVTGTRIATIDRLVAPGAGTATFGVTVSDGWGDTIWTRRYDYTPVPIDNTVVDSIVAERAKTLESAFDDPREATTFARGAMFLPAYYPPVSTAVFSDDGTVWLQRESVAGRAEEWLVLDDQGTPIARAELPTDFDVMAIHDDALWGVTYGGVVPFVVRYRVER